MKRKAARDSTRRRRSLARSSFVSSLFLLSPHSKKKTYLFARPDKRPKVPPVPVGKPARQQRLPLRLLFFGKRLRVVRTGGDLSLHHLLRGALRARRALLLCERVLVRLVGGLLLVQGRDALDVVELEVLQGRHLREAGRGGGARAPAPAAAAELHRLAVVVALVVGRDALALALRRVDPVAADEGAEGLAVGARGGAVAAVLAVLELVDVADAAGGVFFLSFFWVFQSEFFFSFSFFGVGRSGGEEGLASPSQALSPPARDRKAAAGAVAAAAATGTPQRARGLLLPRRCRRRRHRRRRPFLPTLPPSLPPLRKKQKPLQRKKTETHPSSVNFIAPSANCCIFWLRSSVALSPFLMIASMSSSVSDAASDEKTISAP